jgi:predicted MFS family arabinose efflux permease
MTIMTIDKPPTNAAIGETTRHLQEPLLSQQQSILVENRGDENGILIDGNDADGNENREQQEIPVAASQQLYDGLKFRDSILIKSLYFLDALGSSAWGRFSAIYYNTHGLNPQHIGVIEGLRTVVPCISMIFWGFIADRFNCRKQVWLWTKVGGSVILLFLALPYVTQSFYRILFVSVIAQLFVSNGAILDAYTLELLGTANKLFYGRYRLYASLSWGMGSMVMGWVADHYGFDWNFIMFGALSFLMIVLVAYYIPNSINVDSTRQEESVTTTTSSSIRSTSNEETDVEDDGDGDDDDDDDDTAGQSSERIADLLILIFQPRVIFFLIEITIMGAAMATVERLLFLYMVNDLDSSTFLCGLSVGVNVIFELPIFWHASSILNFLGSDGMFLLSMTCFVVRVYGYTLLTPSTKWWILALESMHGVTFAMFWIVTTDVSKVLIDKSKGGFWSTTIPSIVQMLYTAVGATIGSVLGGFAMHQFGSRSMYLFTAEVVFCLLLVHLMGSILARTKYCNRIGSLLPYCHNEVENVNVNTDDDVDVEHDNESGEDLPISGNSSTTPT